MDYDTLLSEIEERLGKDFADRLDDAVERRIDQRVDDAIYAERAGDDL